MFCLLFDVSEMLKSMLKMLKSKLESENNAFFKKKYNTSRIFYESFEAGFPCSCGCRSPMPRGSGGNGTGLGLGSGK